MLHRVVTIVLTSSLFLGGCANLTGQSPEHVELQQREALSRWKHCLERTGNLYSDIALSNVGNLVSEHCEGHRRDVLLVYPSSMEKELDLLLRQRSQHKLLKSAAAHLGH